MTFNVEPLIFCLFMLLNVAKSVSSLFLKLHHFPFFFLFCFVLFLAEICARTCSRRGQIWMILALLLRKFPGELQICVSCSVNVVFLKKELNSCSSQA